MRAQKRNKAVRTQEKVGDENGAVLSFTNRSDNRAGPQSPLGGGGDVTVILPGDRQFKKLLKDFNVL